MSSTPDSTSTAMPAESAKAMSELNNLLQIIAGTSALIEGEEKAEQSKELMSMLRTSIERAEKVAQDLSIQAGGTAQKVAMNAELAPLTPEKPGSDGTAPKSIMLVDDEQMALTLMTRVLTEAGFSVITTQSGFECLDQFRRHPYAFQLILLDLTMPFMDGEETFHRLREIRNDVPVLLCTGFIQEERLKRLIGAGLTGFLRKPIAPNEVVNVVRSTMAKLQYSTCAPADTLPLVM